MTNDIKITTTYDNKQVELVFNETILCPVRDIGIVDINLGAKVFNWKIRIVFDESEQSAAFTTKWEYNIDNFQIKLTLFKWMSQNWVELKVPYPLKSKDNTTFYVKLRTEASPNSVFNRSLHLSIWKAI